MKVLNKLIMMLLVLAMVVSLGACGAKTEEAETMDLTPDATVETEVAEVETDDAAVETEEVESTTSIDEIAIAYFENMPEHIYKIDQKEMVERVVAGDEMVIVDIRSAADYEAGHLKGAVNVPWGPAIGEQLTMIPQDKEVMIYCYTGQTAGQAVMTLNAAGINARSVNLGWNLGLSKVEGIEGVTETDVNSFGSESYEVDPVVEEAIMAYYNGLADVADSVFKNYKISEADLAAMIENEEDFYLISNRSAEDFAKGHIQGAVNIPFNKELMSNISDVPKDKKIVVYCYSGQTAGQTTAAMRLMGYDIVSLNGGAGVAANPDMGWINKGYALVTE
ncbi:MAG: sulfurtransferase [Firmicutes bacterium HGW-Firmicutes-5]|nr:MAG: sulfurtransferase [Firmicutes bacterium HGW-Firmicutes-5]